MEITNVYSHSKNGELIRAVSIRDHWRITEYVPKNDTWLFLDETEYRTSALAMMDYI